MAVQINIQDFLAAVSVRWSQRGLGGTPISQGMPAERTQLPYVTVDNVVQTPFRRTNASRINRHRFTLHVWHNTPEDAGALAKRVEDALLFAPLTLANGTVLTVDEPQIRYVEENYKHKAVLDFAAQVKQSVDYSPA